MNDTKVKVTINHEKVLWADWRDNATARALLKKMPFTIKMSNLYGREMCHRFGGGSLPVKASQNKDYAVGDISFWPPLGSLGILYSQNGEVFEQVPIGHVDGDIRFFAGMGEADVLFEVLKEG